jgi:hypothetical protein
LKSRPSRESCRGFSTGKARPPSIHEFGADPASTRGWNLAPQDPFGARCRPLNSLAIADCGLARRAIRGLAFGFAYRQGQGGQRMPSSLSFSPYSGSPSPG